MADGTVSVLSYLAWKDKPEEAAKWIKRGIKKANKVVYKDGYIHNNSFRGVRDVWYHSQGVNNLLGLYAIDVGVNYMREHMPDSARVHYAYMDAGGNAANVVQAKVTIRHLIRASNLIELRSLVDRV